MEFNVNFNTKEFEAMLKRSEREALDAAEIAMHDVTDELTRIASEITPIDKGILTKAHTKKVTRTKDNVKGEVEFSVREGDFNYALWIHEGIYNHGIETQGRSGTTGWSGKRYYVGRKYLERPLKGEEQAFYEHIAKKIKQAVGE